MQCERWGFPSVLHQGMEFLSSEGDEELKMAKCVQRSIMPESA
jgi:hypothetical protein